MHGSGGERSAAAFMEPGEVTTMICYNGTLPFLFTTCEPSDNYYCSLQGPLYGCTRNMEEACIDFHLCNTPEAFLIILGLVVALLTVLTCTGCLWCCCCCFCGRCCQRSCPCFARMRRQGNRNSVSPSEASGKWSMYSGLDHIKQPEQEVHKPSAPPYLFN